MYFIYLFLFLQKKAQRTCHIYSCIHTLMDAVRFCVMVTVDDTTSDDRLKVCHRLLIDSMRANESALIRTFAHV